MPASPIRKLAPYADAARQQRGLHIFQLNIGQPDLPTPPEFWEAIQQARIETLEYSPSPGLDSYRQKLTTYYARFGLQLQPADIMITTGGSEAIRFAFNTCLDPGEEIIVPEPFYANYYGFAVEAGLKLRTIPTTVDNGYELDARGAFDALITPQTRALMICNPANPTGKLYDREELEALRKLALEHDLYLFADEVYKEFCYDGRTFHSVLTLEGMEDRAIVIDSVSKRYSACGARIGCMITKNQEVMQTALKFAQARLSPPTIGQIGAEALIDLPDSYYEGIVADYVQRRNVVLEALAGMPGVVCPKVYGAFYVMPRLPIDNSDRFCQWLLEEFSHEGETVMLAPGTGFFTDPELGRQLVRISYVLETDKLRRAMHCLARALETYPGRLA